MITTAADYYGLLYKIQDRNAPSLAVLLPSDEKIYEIDLNTRTIEQPNTIIVANDHLAEIIYFKCHRYFQNIDLATTTGVIEYISADGHSYMYPIPFYDVNTCSVVNPETNEEEDFILFPWVIDRGATAQSGQVQFSIRFYRLGPEGKQMQYNLNLLPSKVEIVQGLRSDLDLEEAENVLANYAETVLGYLKNASDIGVFWLDV